MSETNQEDNQSTESSEKTETLAGAISPHHIDLLKSLKDTHLSLSVRLREMQFPIGKLLSLTPGSFLRFKSHLNEPADVIVNKKKVARGKVVQKGKRYGIRMDEFLN
ncbi:MAG: hypothetical protein GWP59_05915 [Chlamydiales bacterium]|nr:FliM/FliN family flagellar motor C-terminal domain-containing protein [Chlamydiales bacterium]NCF71218.1 hypothetical protein [Chlamydiales bacterium]